MEQHKRNSDTMERTTVRIKIERRRHEQHGKVKTSALGCLSQQEVLDTEIRTSLQYIHPHALSSHTPAHKIHVDQYKHYIYLSLALNTV